MTAALSKKKSKPSARTSKSKERRKPTMYNSAEYSSPEHCTEGATVMLNAVLKADND